MKRLEDCRKELIAKKVKELLDLSNDIEGTLFSFFQSAFETNRDLLMPIQKFLPYKKILASLTIAMVIATICALFHNRLNHVLIIETLGISLNDILIVLLIAFSIWPAKLIFDEFTYMKRIIKRFDGYS